VLPPAPKLTFKIPPGQSIRIALEKGIKVSFTSSNACTAAFGASLAPRTAADVAKVPVTLALGSGKLTHRGGSTATLELTNGRSHSLQARVDAHTPAQWHSQDPCRSHRAPSPPSADASLSRGVDRRAPRAVPDLQAPRI
jgi:hypothetical protein